MLIRGLCKFLACFCMDMQLYEGVNVNCLGSGCGACGVLLWSAGNRAADRATGC